MSDERSRPDAVAPTSREVLAYFFRLGFVNIGGPVAQLTMMHDHFVDRAHWLSRERFVRIMGVCHLLPGPEALQLAIYVGYLTRGVAGGLFAGVMFIAPGAVLITALAALYAAYGSVPLVTDALYVLKPAVLGIIAAGLLRIGRSALTSRPLVGIAVAAAVVMGVAGADVIIVMLGAGAVSALAQRRWSSRPPLGLLALPALPLALSLPGWLDFAWVFLRTGLFSFGGAYGSIALLTHGAVIEHGWLTSGALLDGVAVSIATPGPFMLFATWAGYLIAGVPGAIVATVLVFLPSFVFILVGARQLEAVRERPSVRHFLSGVSAAVVAVILLVTLDLAPAALPDVVAAAIALVTFAAIVFVKRDVGLVSLGAMVSGVAYALWRLLA
ncbi:MAG: chromate efflux transporter [Chloroflexi bacterium]|nr:chromate efflux transporter [Chloroflexota bacterium]